MTPDVGLSNWVAKSAEKVLLVDDNAANLQMLFHLLEKNVGCKLLAAKNGEAALAIAQKSLPDLILLDIMMPGIDGFEVCRRLKDDPATRSIPVIFLSALNETADKVKGLELGAVDYVSKPFQSEEVIARVNTHLTIRRLSLEVQTQKDRLENELRIVSKLQRDLIPYRLPDIPGIRLGVYYETSRYAGGDYYDIVKLPNGRCGILVADAEGHSAPATVMMAMTCALFRSCPDLHDQPDRVLDFINRNLCNVNRESFVTAIYAVYDTGSRLLRVARAGHPPPILARPSEPKARRIPCEGMLMMGIEQYERLPITEFLIAPGDRLLFYTDGVSERFDPEDRPYGETRLCRQMERCSSSDASGMLESIVADMERFTQGRPAQDDQLMLLIVFE
jgi:phosphoserine phosphatase RsbU/P